MNHKLPSEQEMTDVFGRFQNSAPPANETAEPKINNRKKNMLSAAAVLLGSGAVFAAINLETISALVEDDETPTDSATTVTADNEIPAETDEINAPMRHHTDSAVQNGTITPNENITIAGQVEEQMTFGQAYAAAREEVGPGGIFSWHGQVYNTYTVEEWQGLSLGQRQEFLRDVGYRPMQNTDLTNGTGSGSAPIEGTPRNEEEVFVEVEEVEPAFIELVINGRPALGIDDDHDGIANAIVFVDEESNDLLALVDAEGDNRIDTAIQYDAINQQVIRQQAIEEPFVAEMSQLEAMSDVVDEPLPYDIAMVAEDEGTFSDDDNDYTDDDGYVNNAELPEMD